MLWRNRRNRFKFTERQHSKRGILALVFALLLLSLYIAVIWMSYRSNGALSMYYGSVGVGACLLSFGVVVLALLSMKEEDSYPLFPRTAMAVSVLTLICWVGTYVSGIIL